MPSESFTFGAFILFVDSVLEKFKVLDDLHLPLPNGSTTKFKYDAGAILEDGEYLVIGFSASCAGKRNP